MVNAITVQVLDALLNKGISDICGNHYDTLSENHYMHFVSHVLGLQITTLCGDMNYKTCHTSATVRYNELFNALNRRGKWEAASAAQDRLLIFVTPAHNVANNYMGACPKKHVGIVCGGQTYNFGNTEHKVRKEPSVDAFRKRLGGVYHDPDIPLFFGVLQ